jgi:hypothetical protein
MKGYFFMVMAALWILPTAGGYAQTNPEQGKQAVQAVSLDNDLRKLFSNDGTLNRGTNMMMRTFDNRAKGYEGSPNVFPQWLPTDIYMKDGYVVKNIPAKLDVYQAQELMIWRKETGDSLLVDATAVEYFVMADSLKQSRHVFKRYPVGDKKAPKFCEVLHEGAYSILAYHTRSFLASDIDKAQSTGRYYDKFISHVAYYILNPDKTLTKLRKNRKSLLKALPPNKDFEAYLDTNNLDFDNPQQLATAIAFYNSLLNQAGYKH